MNDSVDVPPGEAARLRRNEDDGLNYTTTQMAEAIFQSLMRFDGVTAGTAMRASVRAADITS
jgi:hypothetical protein